MCSITDDFVCGLELKFQPYGLELKIFLVLFTYGFLLKLITSSCMFETQTYTPNKNSMKVKNLDEMKECLMYGRWTYEWNKNFFRER